MRRRRRVIGTVVGLIIAAVGAFAAFGPHVLDPSKVKNAIRSLIESKGGVQVRSIACPSNVKEQKGVVSYCTATLAGGQSVRVRVTQINDNGDALLTVLG